MARGRRRLSTSRASLIEHTVAEDIEAERHRVYSAFDKMREQIDAMMGQAEFGIGGEHQEVLETYKMFAYDEGWSRRINEAIDCGLTAEAAIERVRQRTRMRMRQIDDPLLAGPDARSRRSVEPAAADRLGPARHRRARPGVPQDAILIARNLGPAELLEYDRRKLKGVILEEGSLTAHVTIVARAMGVPMLGRVRDVRQHDRRGRSRRCSTAARRSPSPGRRRRSRRRSTPSSPPRQKRRAEFAAVQGLPPVTKDGARITVMVNAGLRDDVAALDATGADGIGLFRTEFQFLVSADLAAARGQQRLYRDVLDAAGDKPVIFRTVDVGGDKALPYLDTPTPEDEENPAMGWRALAARARPRRR